MENERFLHTQFKIIVDVSLSVHMLGKNVQICLQESLRAYILSLTASGAYDVHLI